VTEETDLAEARAVLHGFDLGPLPQLDLDDVVRRGHRRRRVVAAQTVAASVVVALVVGVGFAAAHGRLTGTPPPTSTVSPTPTASPSTAVERLTAVMDAVAGASSVHVVSQLGGPGGGSTLDVVVTKDGALGTFTHAGKTAVYLGVGGNVYMKGAALAGSTLPLQDSQIAAAGDRWFLMTHGFSTYMDLTELSRSFYPLHGATPMLGATRTIDGTRTVAVTQPGTDNIFVWYLEQDAPYRPVLIETPDHILTTTFDDWDAPAPTLPSAPAPADVYDPSQG
jgi:hypothetical protein